MSMHLIHPYSSPRVVRYAITNDEHMRMGNWFGKSWQTCMKSVSDVEATDI